MESEAQKLRCQVLAANGTADHVHVVLIMPSTTTVAELAKPVHILVVVTPPPVTLGVLLEAAEAGLPAVWLQDGSFDDAVLALAATSPFKTVHHACIMVESND